jgi:hypothetical protein
MDSVYCALCRRKLPLDQDHVKIEAEVVHTADRNVRDDYVVHPDCYRFLRDGMMQPA